MALPVGGPEDNTLVALLQAIRDNTEQTEQRSAEIVQALVKAAEREATRADRLEGLLNRLLNLQLQQTQLLQSLAGER